MNSTESHWKLAENISYSGFSQLVCDGLRQERKELNHILNPDEHSALGYSGMLNTRLSTSTAPPQHVEDSCYILIIAAGFELCSKFPSLRSHSDNSVERTDLDFNLTSTAV